jgi:hypothetical protein
VTPEAIPSPGILPLKIDEAQCEGMLAQEFARERQPRKKMHQNDAKQRITAKYYSSERSKRTIHIRIR